MLMTQEVCVVFFHLFTLLCERMQKNRICILKRSTRLYKMGGAAVDLGLPD